jgi:hypothetical protein
LLSGVLSQLKYWYTFQLIHTLSLSGYGTNKIAKVLNNRKIPTKGSKVYKNGITRYDKVTGELIFTEPGQLIWKDGTIYDMLTNSMYKGERRYKGSILKVSAIISSAEWQQVQTNLTNNKNKPDKYSKHFYLLKGLLKCNRCNNGMYGLIKVNRGMRLYQCLSKRYNPFYRFCGMKNINIERLNGIIWNLVTNLHIHSDNIVELFTDEYLNADKTNYSALIVHKQDQIKVIQSKIKRLVELYENESIDMQIFEERTKEHNLQIGILQDEIYELEVKIGVVEGKHKLIKQLQKQFLDLKTIKEVKQDEQRRTLLLWLVNVIYVDYLDEINQHSIKVLFKMPILNTSKNLVSVLLERGVNTVDRINSVTEVTLLNQVQPLSSKISLGFTLKADTYSKSVVLEDVRLYT